MDAQAKDIIDANSGYSQLEQLFEEARLYRGGPEFRDLLRFVGSLPRLAPFNAMLLHVQKPGLSYAASAREWRSKFGRWPKKGARPLLILQPFGPVALVYDVQDTEGEPLPKGVLAFTAKGRLSDKDIREFVALCRRNRVYINWIDAGDHLAGYIGVRNAPTSRSAGRYGMSLNRNHSAVVQFSTLTHELGHLYLGHLGGDRKLGIPDRSMLNSVAKELEAESVSYLVNTRRGIDAPSARYLSQFFNGSEPPAMPDAYHIMRVAGRVENLLSGRASTAKRRRKRRQEEAPPEASFHEEQASFDFSGA